MLLTDHWGVALEAILIILCPVTNSSWPTDPSNLTTRTHTAEVDKESVPVPRFLIGGPSEHSILGKSAFRFSSRPALHGSHLGQSSLPRPLVHPPGHILHYTRVSPWVTNPLCCLLWLPPIQRATFISVLLRITGVIGLMTGWARQC